ncbi:LytR/AlgR family response regulator transcription factor [Hathewaya histolytica]|uniref:LytR/AlgR family response regulator transcription factor n=1 Tax=Hathewaya histolytica TaxID=1498 RepID=UPI003B6703E2
MKNILIVEDEKFQRKNLKNILLETFSNIKVYEAEDKKEALNICNKAHIDIFFIDISLKESSGLEFALEMRNIKGYELTWVVFLTTHIEYITQAFKQVHCYDYILKPYDKQEVIDMAKRLISHTPNKVVKNNIRKHVVLEIRTGISVKIYIDEIIFIETNLRTSFIHTVNGTYKVNKLPLKKILELIDDENIIQCHKSFAANITFIRKIESVNSKLSEIYFENYKDKALLGYKFKNEVLEKFS